ncbi:hypothetical protein BDY21DRAFT_364889 [Lineolata rhizophorae]|uniref:Uncharacterized protein n=1 Tax=Lineolata rhizophorae TaxID=578093 RepID=A0A6A6NX65_9PEZI|nr:hypothetical protein BDY21DRAFT_364889 [Lineolata rhizophorae]
MSQGFQKNPNTGMDDNNDQPGASFDNLFGDFAPGEDFDPNLLQGDLNDFARLEEILGEFVTGNDASAGHGPGGELAGESSLTYGQQEAATGENFPAYGHEVAALGRNTLSHEQERAATQAHTMTHEQEGTAIREHTLAQGTVEATTGEHPLDHGPARMPEAAIPGNNLVDDGQSNDPQHPNVGNSVGETQQPVQQPGNQHGLDFTHDTLGLSEQELYAILNFDPPKSAGPQQSQAGQDTGTGAGDHMDFNVNFEEISNDVDALMTAPATPHLVHQPASNQGGPAKLGYQVPQAASGHSSDQQAQVTSGHGSHHQSQVASAHGSHHQSQVASAPAPSRHQGQVTSGHGSYHQAQVASTPGAYHPAQVTPAPGQRHRQFTPSANAHMTSLPETRRPGYLSNPAAQHTQTFSNPPHHRREPPVARPQAAQMSGSNIAPAAPAAGVGSRAGSGPSTARGHGMPAPTQTPGPREGVKVENAFILRHEAPPAHERRLRDIPSGLNVHETSTYFMRPGGPRTATHWEDFQTGLVQTNNAARARYGLQPYGESVRYRNQAFHQLQAANRTRGEYRILLGEMGRAAQELRAQGLAREAGEVQEMRREVTREADRALNDFKHGSRGKGRAGEENQADNSPRPPYGFTPGGYYPNHPALYGMQYNAYINQGRAMERSAARPAREPVRTAEPAEFVFIGGVPLSRVPADDPRRQPIVDGLREAAEVGHLFSNLVDHVPEQFHRALEIYETPAFMRTNPHLYPFYLEDPLFIAQNAGLFTTGDQERAGEALRRERAGQVGQDVGAGGNGRRPGAQHGAVQVPPPTTRQAATGQSPGLRSPAKRRHADDGDEDPANPPAKRQRRTPGGPAGQTQGLRSPGKRRRPDDDDDEEGQAGPAKRQRRNPGGPA